MTLLGFGSCSTTPVEDNLLEPTVPTVHPGEYWVAYGTPLATYQAALKVSGTVRDTSGKPIEGIKVLFDKVGVSANDIIFTDSKGRFEGTVFFSPKKTVNVYFRDVDGPDNGGSFPLQGVSVKTVKITDGNNSWPGGAYEAKVNVKLKKE